MHRSGLWMSLLASLLAGGVATGPVHAAEGGSGGRALPAGFQRFAGPDGGEVLVTVRPGERSAQAALRQTLEQLDHYFDGRPRVLAALGDERDQHLQVSFGARLQDQVNAGLALVDVAGPNSVVALLVDRADRLPESRAALEKLLRESLPAPAVAGRAWRRVRLPDGTGAMSLPEGWRITSSANSMVEAEGPEGCVKLGMYTQVWTPRAAAAWQALYGFAPPTVISAEPADAVNDMTRLYLATMGLAWRRDQVESTPVTWMPGTAALVHFKGRCTAPGTSTELEVLALVSLNPNADGTHTYYCSSVAAPPRDFARNLPVLQQVWQSWQTDPEVFTRRLVKATESLRECGRLAQEANDYRQWVMARAGDDWSEYIRGTRIVRDEQSGELRTHSTYDLEKILEVANRHEGHERWRIIPLKDLNNP